MHTFSRLLLGTIIGCIAPVLVANALPVQAEARIAILASNNSPSYQETVRGFKQAVQLAVPNAIFDEHWLQGDAAQAEAAAMQAGSIHPMLFFTVGSLATQSVARVMPGIPIVAAMILNAGEFKSTANATGVVLELPLETELHWLQRLLPDQRHIGVLYSPSQNQARVTEAVRLAKSLGLVVHAQKVTTPRDLPDAMESLANQAGVLFGLADTMVLNQQTAQSLLLFSLRNRIPFVGLSRSWVKAGALYALERDYSDIGRQCGVLGLKILRGEPAASLPPETPHKINYVINLKVAQQMKIEFPAALVKGALEVIE